MTDNDTIEGLLWADIEDRVEEAKQWAQSVEQADGGESLELSRRRYALLRQAAPLVR